MILSFTAKTTTTKKKKRQEFRNLGNIIKLSGRGMALVVQWFRMRGFAGGRKRKTFKVSKIIKAFTVSKLLALQKLRHSNSRIQYCILQGGPNSLHIQQEGKKDTTRLKSQHLWCGILPLYCSSCRAARCLPLKSKSEQS